MQFKIAVILKVLVCFSCGYSLAFGVEAQKYPKKKKSLFWAPLGSFLVPGLDQWWEKQYTYGAALSTTGLSGAALMIGSNSRFDQEIGFDLWITSGALSAYQSFRTAIYDRTGPGGDFSFAKNLETPEKLALAPFDFRHLIKPEVLLPLIGIAGYAFWYYPTHDLRRSGSPRERDVVNAFSRSMRAGVWEEAIFRGYFMPLLMKATGSEAWSVAISGAVFGGLHYSDENYPLLQTLAGLWFGHVVVKYNWQLAPSTFMHFWWDFLLMTGDAIANRKVKGEIYFRLPQINFTF